MPTDVLERWLQPLSSAGLFLIALVGVLIGRPFVREYAEQSVDDATARSEGFKSVTDAMTWMWVAAFGIMLVSTLIPPIVDGDATIRDMENPLSILCYWVIPFTVLGVAGAVSAVFPPWFEKRSAAIDQRSAVHPTVVAQAPPPADLATDGVRIEAPADSRMDEPFGVSIDLSAAGKPHPTSATVTTSGHDLYGHLWRSRAELAVPPSGVVDLAVHGPVSRVGLDHGGRRRADLGDDVRRRERRPRGLHRPDRTVAGDDRGPCRRRGGSPGARCCAAVPIPGVRFEPTDAGRAARDAGAPGRRPTGRRLARGRLLRRLGGRVRIAARRRRAARLARLCRAGAGLDLRAPTRRPGSTRYRWNDLPPRWRC